MQYNMKSFVFQLSLFIYLVTTKLGIFMSITEYNPDFQIIMNKLSSLGENLPTDLKPASYLQGIKVIYPNFTTAYRSATFTKVLEIWEIMVEEEDDCW